MRRVHIVGRKNQGKTSLIVDLVREFTSRGLRVGTIKHTHHHHELDTPGKDSHDHRTAGAAAVGIVSPGLSAVFLPRQASLPHNAEEAYQQLAPMFAACEVVLVEGDQQARAPKIEVWRAEVGPRPLAETDATIVAVVSNDAPHLDVPVLPRSDVPALADWILHLR